ncbi:PREDICTED: uncharacterized protein LOC109192834 [Ipomoea nil]|uniref:uncharacterized protein LOC109192834 n=1 Tax=Ipomoea nil TaxID=35883 RepID=UPI000900F538|nr:PREDICTED: uncharacterized protein LOC109192834 [Ipomoea nil]
MYTATKPASDVTPIKILTGGMNYKRWAARIIMLLEEKDVDYVIYDDPTTFILTATTAATTATATTAITEAADKSGKTADQSDKAADQVPAPRPVRSTSQVCPKYVKDNKTARASILQRVTNSIFDMFSGEKSAKAVWEQLQEKYGSNDTSRRKYVVGRWLHFQMTESKTVVEQVHDFENMVSDMQTEGAQVNDAFLIEALVDKLSGSWKKGKSDKCYVCGKRGHRDAQCYHHKGSTNKNSEKDGSKNQANVVETTEDDEAVAAVITEINMVGDPDEWVVDTGASRHFCNNKSFFKVFEPVTGGEQVFMGNSSISEVSGRGKVELLLNSGKKLLLNNVLYVPSA